MCIRCDTTEPNLPKNDGKDNPELTWSEVAIFVWIIGNRERLILISNVGTFEFFG